MKAVLKGGALVFGATLVWQLSNFGFNVVGAHELGPEKYGILASAMALSYLLNPVVTAVQTVASRESTSVMVDDQGSHIRPLVNYYLARVGLGAFVVTVVVVLLSPLISQLLHLNSAVLVCIFALVIPFIVGSSVVRGVHQGTRYFARYSLGTLTEGLTKISSATVFLVFLWRSPISALLALFVSAAAGLMVNLRMLKHFPKPKFSVRPNRHPVSSYVTTFSIFGLLAILISLDTITARAALSAHSAGVYAALSLAGKVVYFVTTSLTGFFFPMFSARFDQGMRTRRWLGISVILVIVSSAVVVAVYALAPDIFISILFGRQYIEIAPDMWVIGTIFAVYGMMNLFVLYLLARRQKGIQFPLAAAVVVQIGGFAIFHRSVADVMSVMAAAFGVALLGCASLIVLASRKGNRHAEVHAEALSVGLVIRGKHRADRAVGHAARRRSTDLEFPHSLNGDAWHNDPRSHHRYRSAC